MLESRFEKKFLERVKSLPGAFVPPKVDAVSVRGVPDRVICIGGKYVALEFKRSASELKKPRSVLQEYTLNEVTRAGGFARFVVPDNAEYVFDMLRRLSDEWKSGD